MMAVATREDKEINQTPSKYQNMYSTYNVPILYTEAIISLHNYAYMHPVQNAYITYQSFSATNQQILIIEVDNCVP